MGAKTTRQNIFSYNIYRRKVIDTWQTDKLKKRSINLDGKMMTIDQQLEITPSFQNRPIFKWRSRKQNVVKLLLWSISSFISIDRGLSQAQSASPKPQIPSELERLEYFEGTWNCQQPAGSTEASGKFTWTVNQDLNQFWYVANAKQTLAPTNGFPINSREFMGYDSASKQLIRSVVVSNGNSYNLTARDWQDNKLIWSGVIIRQGEATLLRQEIVKNSPDRFVATYFFADESKEWIPVVDESCDRVLP